MQLTALLPLLALLGAAPSLAHSNLDRRVQHSNHAKLAAREETAALHARAAERIQEQVSKRQPPVALASKPRKVKRGAAGCRPRGASYTPSASASTAAASETPAAASSAAADQASASASPSTDNLAANAQISIGVSIGGGSSNSGGGSSAGVDGMTPNGIKAGLSGTDTIDAFGSHVGWFWNYGPTSDTSSSLTFMPTLWGNGQSGESQDWSRLQAFEQMNWNPTWVQGFYEPDCSPPMSSSIDPSTAAWQWNQWVVPHKANGAYLVSPGMCKQLNEDWLTPFLNAGATPWDITSVHINKLDVSGAKADLDYYWNTYGKPIFVTEFACVDDQNGFTPSTDQGQINQYINDLVDLFEGDDRVKAYSMSEGEGLGNVWPPWQNGQLTESGQTYLNAISKYH